MISTNQTPGVEPLPSALVDRLYTGAMISLALLLLGLAVFRPAPGLATSEMVLKYERRHDPDRLPWTEVAASMQRELTSPVAVQGHLADIDRSLSPTPPSDSAATLADQISQEIDIQVVPSTDDEGLAAVSIRCHSESDDFQAAFLNAIYKSCLAKHHHPLDTAVVELEHEAARSRVATSVADLDAAQARADKFMKGRLAKERQRHEASLARFLREQATPTARASKSASRLAIVESYNPQHSELQAELAELKTRHVRAAKQSNRSETEALSGAIRELEGLLKETPQTVPLDASAVSNPYVKSSTVGERPSAKGGGLLSESGPLTESGPNPPPQAAETAIPRFDEFESRVLVESEPEYQVLLASIADAKRRHEQVLDTFKLAQGPADALVETMEISAPTRIVSRQAARVTAFHFLAILVPSLMVGIICTLFRVPAAPPDSFVSPADVEQWLDLPIVGSITTGDGPDIPTQPPSAPPNAIRWARRAAECGICIAMVVVIFAIITVSGFGSSLINDPFSAYSQAFDHITKF